MYNNKEDYLKEKLEKEVLKKIIDTTNFSDKEKQDLKNIIEIARNGEELYRMTLSYICKVRFI